MASKFIEITKSLLEKDLFVNNGKMYSIKITTKDTIFDKIGGGEIKVTSTVYADKDIVFRKNYVEKMEKGYLEKISKNAVNELIIL